jgi:hypothetical protein
MPNNRLALSFEVTPEDGAWLIERVVAILHVPDPAGFWMTANADRHWERW